MKKFVLLFIVSLLSTLIKSLEFLSENAEIYQISKENKAITVFEPNLILKRFDAQNLENKNLTNVKNANDTLHFIANFTKGKLDGLVIFNNLTAERASCNIHNDPEILNDIYKICDLIKSMKDSSDYLEVIRRIIVTLQDLKPRKQELCRNCTELAKRMGEIVLHVVKYSLSPIHMAKVYGHTLLHLFDIKQKAMNFITHLNNKEAYEAGFDYGDLIRYVLYWDYNPQNHTSILQEKGF